MPNIAHVVERVVTAHMHRWSALYDEMLRDWREAIHRHQADAKGAAKDIWTNPGRYKNISYPRVSKDFFSMNLKGADAPTVNEFIGQLSEKLKASAIKDPATGAPYATPEVSKVEPVTFDPRKLDPDEIYKEYLDTVKDMRLGETQTIPIEKVIDAIYNTVNKAVIENEYQEYWGTLSNKESPLRKRLVAPEGMKSASEMRDIAYRVIMAYLKG